MEERSSGIIMRVRPLSETSLIVHWLTPELGRIATVAKGAHRPKSLFRGKLDLFFEAEFSFIRSRRSELHILKEVALLETHSGIRRDLRALAQASYAGILIERFTERETPQEETFELVRDFIRSLATPPTILTALAFELRFLEVQGLAPRLEGLSENTRKLAQALWSEPFSSARNLEFDRKSVAELEQLTRRAVGTALGILPPQRKAALA